MKRVLQTAQFSRDIKKMGKRGKDLAKLREIVKQLAVGRERALIAQARYRQ